MASDAGRVAEARWLAVGASAVGILAGGATAMDRPAEGGLDARGAAMAGVAVASTGKLTSRAARDRSASAGSVGSMTASVDRPGAAGEVAVAAGAGPTEEAADWPAALDGAAPSLAGAVSTAPAERVGIKACPTAPPPTGSGSGTAVQWSFRATAGFASGGD